MWIKRFRAHSLDVALEEVREEFGPDALILSTRKVRRKGLLGWLGRRSIEVTAAMERSDKPSERPNGKSEGKADKFLEEVRRVFPDKPVAERLEPAATAPDEPAADVPHQLSSTSSNGVQRSSQLVTRTKLYNSLIANGVRGNLARRLVNEAARKANEKHVPASEVAKAARKELVGSMVRLLGYPEPLPTEPMGQPLVAVFVGPTGVGKTTTIAKLAARYSIEHDWNVEVITSDFYRVAAVDQLEQYASLIGVPIHTARTPEEAREAIDGSTADLILVDTAGRSHLDEPRMDELSDFVEVLRPDLTFLCVSLTSRDADALDVMKRYSTLSFNRLLLTKLDETRQPGLYLNLADRVKVPLSYVSTGQAVPEDLVRANAHELAQQLLEVST